MADNRFCADYAKRVAGCKKCKEKIEKGQLRFDESHTHVVVVVVV